MTRTGKDKQEPRSYLSYLLRLWQAGSMGSREWRASLESVQSGERLAFARLEELFQYLRAETGVEAAEGFGNRASARPRFPEAGDRRGKGGADANSVDPEPADL